VVLNESFKRPPPITKQIISDVKKSIEFKAAPNLEQLKKEAYSDIKQCENNNLIGPSQTYTPTEASTSASLRGYLATTYHLATSYHLTTQWQGSVAIETSKLCENSRQLVKVKVSVTHWVTWMYIVYHLIICCDMIIIIVWSCDSRLLVLCKS